MVFCGVPPDIWTYSILLDGFCKNGKLDKALVIFEDLQKSATELNIVTYNIPRTQRSEA
ncbi:BnaC03g69710D [Brassica napus]|uniref:BnaC03g69710D protein n=1 Tax=Brassica napus TaxID=3708 RepID=A0A078GKB3_BRANA|nr:BnaC03g69710D [Brassica napus]